MSTSRYLSGILTVIAVLLAFNLWIGLTSHPVEASVAQAQGIPNAAAQRNQMVDQLKLANTKLDALTKLFESGKARVSVQVAAEDAGRE